MYGKKIARVTAVAVTLCLVAAAWLVAFVIPFGVTVKAVALDGLGTASVDKGEGLYGGLATQRYIVSNDGSYPQKSYTVTFDPKNDVMPKMYIGQAGASIRETVTAMTRYAGSVAGGNQNVIASINADFFDTTYGPARGLTVSDGRVIHNSITSNRHIFGFTRDGTAVWGVPTGIGVTYKVNGGVSKNIAQINRYRKGGTGIYLLTDDFGATTQSQNSETGTGYDVVLTITGGGYLKIGGTLTATVASLHDTPSSASANTPIGRGQAVITSNSAADLVGLTVGASVEITITDTTGNWARLYNSTGSGSILVKDGQGSTLSATDTAPRSAIGVKADGTCVFFQNDGRQTNVSQGLRLRQVADFLKSLGCVDAFELDGGGSSAILTRKPGDAQATLRNKPSGSGGERKVANAWG